MTQRSSVLLLVAALTGTTRSFAETAFDAQGPGRATAPAEGVQAPGPIVTLEEVLSSVDRSYPLVRAALAEQSEAAAAARAAAGGFDPSVRASATLEPVGGYPKQLAQVAVEQATPLWGASVFGGYRIGRGDFAVYDGKLATNEHGELRAGVRVPLLRDGPIDRRRAAIRTADLGGRIAELGVEQHKVEARRLATLRYWDWLASGARRDAVRAWLELAQERDVALAARVARGDVPEIERAENRRAILQREAVLAAAERDVVQAGIELGLFLRDDAGRPRRLVDDRRPADLPPPTAFDLTVAGATATALERRPDVKRLELARRRGEIERELSENQRLPAVDLVGAGSKDLGPGDVKRGEPVLEATLLIDVPILNRVAGGRADAAVASLRRTDEQLRLARDRATADVQSGLVSLDAARRRADVAERELAVARDLARAEMQRFELGESTLLLVNLREQASAEAQVRRIDAVADIHRAIAGLRAAVARNGARDP